jgi:hypothetical protein
MIDMYGRVNVKVLASVLLEACYAGGDGAIRLRPGDASAELRADTEDGGDGGYVDCGGTIPSFQPSEEAWGEDTP